MNKSKASNSIKIKNASVSDVPLRSSSSSSTAMVCSDVVLYGLMDKLVGGRQDRLVIPIVGIGGIGKTTLALSIYEHKTIKDHFVVRAWITISQKCDTRELLCEVLAQVTNQKKENLGDKSENKVKVEMYQYLFGRRFLIVMDDMWSIDAWEKIQRYFPDNSNGSRKMPQLRHIEFPGSRVCLPDPPPSEKDGDVVIMENLQVIKGVENFKCSEEVFKRIPNLKKLKTGYWEPNGRLRLHEDYYCVRNFQFLSKLEHLSILCSLEPRAGPYLYKLSFPNSLKILSLVMNDEFEWEEIIEKIGSLPHLEKLTLVWGWFRSGKWEMVEGQFQELRYLELAFAYGLKQWIVEDSSVLPRLQQLFLHGVDELEEFPMEIGNITTLQQVELLGCSEAVVRSAREMVDEQVEVQGDPLPFHVHVELLFLQKEALQRLSTPNFTVVVED